MRYSKSVFNFVAICALAIGIAGCFKLFEQETPEPKTITRVVCPSDYAIPPEMQEKLLVERATMQRMNLNNTLELLERYGELRNKLRACGGVK